MDTVTHALAGVVLGRATGETDRGRLLGWALAAVAPDLDGLAALGGRAAYYELHRAVLHGLAPALLLSLALGVLLARGGLFDRRTGALVGVAAVGSHLALDWVGAFGLMLWYPVSAVPIYGDLLFIVDLWLSGILLVALLWAWLRPASGRGAARVGLAAAVLYIAAAWCSHERALAMIAAEQDAGRAPRGTASALPQPPSLLSWVGFVRTDRGVWAGPLRPWAAGPSAPLVSYPFPSRDGAFASALATEPVRRFLALARFPVVTTEVGPGGSTFRFEDLRFSFSGHERSNAWISVRVEIAPDGVVRYAGYANP